MNVALFRNPLFWIIGAAFLLRISGVPEGLPALYNSTEHTVSKFALKMGALRTLDPGFYIYPALLQNIFLVLYFLIYVVGLFTGIYVDAYDFAAQYLIDPSVLLVSGRLFSVFVSTLSVLIFYRVIAEMESRRVALIAAAYMAFSYYMVLYSHLGIHEPLMIFLTVLSLRFLWKSIHELNHKDLFWSGILSGLAIATKYTTGFLVAGIIVAALQFKTSRPKSVIIALGGLLIGFLMGNPYSLIAPQKFIAGFLVVSQQMYEAVETAQGIPVLWQLKNVVQNELLLGVLFICVPIYFCRKNHPFFRVSMSVVIPTIFVVVSWTKLGMDYLLVCWPFLISLAALITDDLLAKFNKKMRFIFAVLLAVLILKTTHQVILKITPDTRAIASTWLLERLEPHQKICYDKNTYDLQLVDLQRYAENSTHSQFLPDQVKKKLSNQTELKRNVRFIRSYELKQNLLADSVYFDYAAQTASVSWKALDQILSEGADWLIVNHTYRDTYIRTSNTVPDYIAPRIEKMKKFYSDLEHRFPATKVFRPSFWRAGPVISVYRLF